MEVPGPVPLVQYQLGVEVKIISSISDAFCFMKEERQLSFAFGCTMTTMTTRTDGSVDHVRRVDCSRVSTANVFL